MNTMMRLGVWMLALSGCDSGAGLDKDGSWALDYDSELPSSDAPADPAETDPPADSDSPVDAPAECDAEAPVVLWVSPDDSNSMSSPVQAREAALGRGPFYAPVRTWEFFNYYQFDYAPADPGMLAIGLDLVPGAAPDTWTLQVGVSSERVDPAERAPMNLTFVLDTSGSMSGPGIARTKDIGRVIARQLHAGDVVSMVTWDTRQNVVLDGVVVAGPDDVRVLSAFEGLTADGATDLSSGLATGFRLAERNRAPDRINRVILVSDGGANVGVTDAQVIGEHAGSQDEDGVYLVGVGVGIGESYNDRLMDAVTDLGKGASVFIPSSGEAERMFGDRFLETLGVAARNVQLRYTLPPGFEIVKFSGEELSTDPRQIDPQHLAPNDTMVLHQTLTTCAPDAVGPDTPIEVHVTWQDAVTFEPREATLATTFGALEAAPSARLRKGQAVAAYVDALVAVREQDGAEEAVQLALEAVSRAEADGADPELAELRGVLETVQF